MTEIRTMTPADWLAFRNWRGGDNYTDGVIGFEFEEHLARRRIILLAVDGPEIIGTVQFVLSHDDPELGDGRTIAYLQALEVRPDHRRRGVGRSLVKKVEALASGRGFAQLALMVEPDNRPALGLYEKCGFTAFKESTDTWRDREYPVLCLRKSLAPAQGSLVM